MKYYIFYKWNWMVFQLWFLCNFAFLCWRLIHVQVVIWWFQLSLKIKVREAHNVGTVLPLQCLFFLHLLHFSLWSLFQCDSPVSFFDTKMIDDVTSLAFNFVPEVTFAQRERAPDTWYECERCSPNFHGFYSVSMMAGVWIRTNC